MKKLSFTFAAVALGLASGVSATAQQLPPVRQIGPVVTTTSEKLGAVSAIRQLSDGRVLVNDIIGRRVLLFDSTLKTFTVVADTTSATANAYGSRAGGLIAYRGDTTLFVDPASLSMLVVDPNGKIARVMSAPRANDANFLVGGPFGTPGFDRQGRLIYRAPPRIAFGGAAQRGGAPTAGGPLANFTPPSIPDSAPLVRVDLVTRKLDTLAFFKTPKIQMNVSRDGDGIRVMPTVNPLPVIDDWGILPDGTVALVRGRDYHIDWITPEKAITSSAKIPFEWERLNDEAKVAFIDSTRTAFEAARARGDLSGMFGGAFGGAPMIRMGGPGAPGGAGTPGGAGATATPAPGAAPGGQREQTTVIATGPGTTTAGAGGGVVGQLPRVTFVEPSELPDYKPPFAGGATRVDAEGNLWIRTTQNLKGVPVYNVVNRKGELVDRVQLPAGRVIAGFGAGGVVYLGFRDGDVARLEKAKVR